MPSAENKRRMLSRREMLALTGVFGASLLFGLVPGAMRAFALADLRPTTVTDITNRRLFLRSNTMAILDGELLFSKKPSELDDVFGTDDSIDSSGFLFHWEFKENFQFQWSQDTDATDDNNMSNDTMFSGWCLVPNVSNKAQGVLNVKWDPEENSSVNDGDAAAQILELTLFRVGYDAWGRSIGITLTLDVNHVCTGTSPRKVNKRPNSPNTTYIPVLVWANNLPAAGSSATTGHGRGPTFWLADGKPSEANVVALSLTSYFRVFLSDPSTLPPGVEESNWSFMPKGDFVVNCYDMDQPSWWHLYKTGATKGTWDRDIKYVESMWTPAPWEGADDDDSTFSFFDKAYRPANPLVTVNTYTQEEVDDRYYWWFNNMHSSTLNARWSGRAKGVSENYDRNIAVLVASDGTSSDDDVSREYHFGWQGSGCKSILSFGSERGDMNFVETRIIGGLGKVVYPNGKVVRTFDPEDVTDRTDNPYMRKYFFKGATPGAYGLNTGALKSDGKPPYTFTPADGWRIEYLRYRKYTSAQNGAWTNVNVGDGTEPVVLFDRPHGCGVLPWAKIKNDWQCEVKFVENVGKLWLYKHDAESPDHSAQGDGVLGGDRAYGAPSNPGATFKVWRKDGSQFFYKGTKVSEATAKVPQNSPLAYAEFSQIEVGEYYWQEIAAPDGYRIDTTRHEVTITPWRAEGDEVTAICSNYIKRGGVRLKKIDFDSTIDNANKHKIDLEWGEPQGNATLAGAEFKVYSISAQGVKVNGQWFPATYHSAADIRNPGSAAGCLLTLVTNENGEVSSANNVLPYGTYVIFETKAPAGYLLNEAFAAGVAFTVREDGGYVQFNGHEGYLT